MMQVKTTAWNQMLAIAVFRENRLEPVGTGFLVGPKIAFTATHTIDDVATENAILALQVVNRGDRPLLWRVSSMYRSPSEADRNDLPLDIALLQLESFGEPVEAIEKHRDWFFQLNVATPKVGQQVVAYGFSKSQIRIDSIDPMLFELSHAFRHVEGRVVEVRWPRRDLGQLPFPCFAVDADFEPGMSGGPIFNERDQVCGLVSTGGISGMSWASILWPALGIRFKNGHLLDYARNGKIVAKNHHCVSLHYEEGSFPRVIFNPNLELP